MLTTLDYSLIIAYIIIVLMVGLSAGKKETKEEFLIAGRKLNFFTTAVTLFVNKVGAGILLTYSALVYLYGAGAIWFFIGAIFGYFVFYFFAKKIKKMADEKNFYTLADFFFDQKGKLAGFLVSLIVVISMFWWVVVNFTGGAKILTEYSPINFEWAVIIMWAVVLSYLLMGGFKAVVKTDIIQGFGLFTILFLIIFSLFFNIPTFSKINIDFFSIPIGQIVNFFLAGLLLPFAAAELWQRVYAAKNIENLKKWLIIWSTMYVIVGILLTLIGLIIRTNLPNLTNDIVLVVGLNKLLPVGLAWLPIVLFCFAALSTTDTFLFSSSASLVQDLLLKSNFIKKENLLKIMRISIISLTIFAIILSIIIRNLVDTTFFFVALMMSLGLLVLIIWVNPKINKYSINLSILFSLVGVILLAILNGISTSLVVYSLWLCVAGLIIGGWFNYFKKW
ncbi:MAG: hypothetical protein ACD_49C00038G0052 [uncultured bacterium (gcode 4)]|uniref:Sodium:solute symporter family protein n=1 Tax=uncultured bacterium (gcode 4) TaxID=1234023 RepID=K2BCK9_9BACT|nr:MAG: hypothetical protein ACD_49C00038G0052 [uncultured bacterium (gcode 4)]